MSYVIGFIVTSIMTFAAFCFYCGVNVIVEKIKKDSLYRILEVAVIAFIVTGTILVIVNKVGNLLTPSVQVNNSRIQVI